MIGPPPSSPLFPYPPLFRPDLRRPRPPPDAEHRHECRPPDRRGGSADRKPGIVGALGRCPGDMLGRQCGAPEFIRQNALLDRESTRLNSSHTVISYAGLCLT